MKITIDTTQDSKRDIQEAIRMLSTLINQAGPGASSSDNTGMVGNTNPEMFNMFNDSSESQEKPTERSEELRIVEY